MNNSEIRNFYDDQTIFITGGTGFLGKLLIEKLLSTCNVRKIYVLLRAKNGKSIQERINTFFDYPCFDRLKKEKTNFENLVMFMEGNCEEINLGLNSEFRRVLVDETNVVFHVAANVKFDQPLRQAANANVRSTRDILEMAKKMLFLKAFIYISTAYSNCPRRHIGEEFYDPPLTANQLMDILDGIDDKLLTKLTPRMIQPWPNCYSFSKSIAEDLIKSEGKHLPIAIIRPSIVTTTLKEPMPGWIDNVYGVIGIVLGAALGVIRSFNCKVDNTANIVPCDYVANMVLVSAWNTAEEKPDNIRIFNYVVSKTNFITWKQLMDISGEVGWDYSSDKIIWHYTFTMRENVLWHKICMFFQHTVLAYVTDFVLICLRRRPLAVKNYVRLNKMITLISYFAVNNWTFDSNNVEELWGKMTQSDKVLFAFDMKSVDWRSFLTSSIVGMRLYLLKDPLDTIPRGLRKVRMLAIAHYSLLTVLYILSFLFFWCIYRLFL